MQGAGFAGIKPLGQVIRGPKIEVANLGAIDAGDAKEMPCRHRKTARIAGRNKGFGDLFPPVPRGLKRGDIGAGKGGDGVADYGRNFVPNCGIFGGGVLGIFKFHAGRVR